MRWLALYGSLSLLAAGAMAEPLAEVAERAKAQRKGDGAAKTITQEDMDRAAAARQTPEPDDVAAAPVQPPTPSPSATPRLRGVRRDADSAASDMAALERRIHKWRALYSGVQTRIDALERQIARLEQEDAMSVELSALSRSSCSRRRGLGAANSERRSRLDLARSELAQRQSEIETIAEQARLDGVASGQLY